MKRATAVGMVLTLVLLMGAAGASGQDMVLQGNNELRWADGKESLGSDEITKRYFENRLNLNLYYGDVRFGSRITLLQPSEFGEQRDGINTLEKRFLEYQSGDLKLRVGDFYTVWGRGLGLALVEDIIQGFDSGLDGAHARYQVNDLEVEGLSGRSAAGYLGQVREANVSAGRVGYSGPYGLTGSVSGMLVTPVEGVSSYSENRTWAGYASWDGPSMSIWTEYAKEDIDGIDDTHDAFYSSIDWFADRFSLYADYKRYRYYKYAGGLSDAGSVYAQSVDILPFHSPPIVQRDFTSALFSKHPHIVRFDDEVGIQVEGTVNLGNSNTVAVSYSQSSSFVEDELIVPSLDEENSPYRQVFVEYTGYPRDDLYLIAWAGADEDLVYTREGDIGARSSWLRRSVLGAGGELSVGYEWSFKGQLETGLVEDVDRETTSFESLSILGVTWQRTYSVSVTLETAEDDGTQDKTSWLKGELSAVLGGGRHELLLTVGEERGGLVCTSGKCRLVAPFEGVKLTLTSIF